MSDQIVTIQSSWLHDKNGDNIIIIESEDEKNNEKLIEDIVSIPVVLQRPEQDTEGCILRLISSIPGQNVIVKRFEICSSTKTIEAYHNTDGYLFCSRGKAGSVGDESSFNCVSNFDFSCTEFYFKFPVKEDVKVIKLFKVKLKVTIEQSQNEILRHGTIDLEKVKGYLGDIPENAQGLFKNMEAYQKNQQSLQSSMLAGNGIGGFGMMGLMAAMMGNMSMSSSKNHDQKTVTSIADDKLETKTQNIETLHNKHKNKEIEKNSSITKDSDQKTVSRNAEACTQEIETIQNEQKFKDMDTKPSSNEETDILETEITKPNHPLTNDSLSRLLNGGGDAGMFDILKGICSSVTQQRTQPSSEIETHEKSDEVEIEDTTKPNKKNYYVEFEQQLKSTEDRLKLYVDQQLSAMEERINEKLDRILTCLTEQKHDKPP